MWLISHAVVSCAELLWAAADITVSRTINSLSAGSIKVTLPDGECSSSDQYGSNNCDLDWGKAYKVSFTGELSKDIESGSTFTADIKVDNVFPLQFTCQLCGAECSFTVPVIKKSVSFKMPDCPIKAQSLTNSTTITLPSKDPVPLKIGFEGSVSAKDASGATIADVDVKGEVASSAIMEAKRLETESVEAA
jgi:hypothetical protein